MVFVFAIMLSMALRWSARRQLLYASAGLLVVVVLSVWGFFSFIYSPPSCFDGEQNQDEVGVDCGGSCALLCEAPNVSAVWTRSVPVAPGVYHAVSLVRNPDTNAEGLFAYTISLFDQDNILVATREGVFEIRPGEVTPLFEANIVSGERDVARTFIDIVEGNFKKTERKPSVVRVLSWELDEEARTLSATIENQNLERVSNATVTALLFDEEDILIAASQTQSGSLDSRERKTVTFTWQEPFSKTPQQVDIIPRVEE